MTKPIGHPVPARPAAPAHAEIVVIGGGIMGLATAYHLALGGVRDVVVVERSYLCSGASGRNGGGVRAQWSTETNIRLMQESLRLIAQFAQQMRINVWFRRGGYLFLVRTEEKLRLLEKSVELQNACGLPTRIVEPKEARDIVPELSTEGVIAACYNPEDGVVFPWPFLWGYARACERLGVQVLTFTNVNAIEVVGRTIRSVVTDRGAIATGRVVNAAGAWSPEVARLAGVALPNQAQRHEICSTEPLKPFLVPLVADLTDGLYFSQSLRGEIVGGISDPATRPGLDQRSTPRFLARYGRALVRTMPRLGSIKVIRQWAGCYDMTPDDNPILGEVDAVDEFYQTSGFGGHGFMIAPVIGRLLGQHIVERTRLPIFEQWNLRRFGRAAAAGETLGIG